MDEDEIDDECNLPVRRIVWPPKIIRRAPSVCAAPAVDDAEEEVMASIPNAKEEEGGVMVLVVVVVVTLGIKANTTKDAALLLLLVIVVLVLLLRLLILEDTHTSTITVQISIRHDATAVDVANNDTVIVFFLVCSYLLITLAVMMDGLKIV